MPDKPRPIGLGLAFGAHVSPMARLFHMQQACQETARCHFDLAEALHQLAPLQAKETTSRELHGVADQLQVVGKLMHLWGIELRKLRVEVSRHMP